MKNIITKTLTVATVGAVMALAGSGHGGTDPGGRRHRRWSRRNDFQVLGPDGKFVGAIGDSLFGYGRVNQINGLNEDAFCANGGGCELTYTFSDYSLSGFNAAGASSAAVFTGGEINLLDDTPDSNLDHLPASPMERPGCRWRALRSPKPSARMPGRPGLSSPTARHSTT